jgi:hypothetical protein
MKLDDSALIPLLRIRADVDNNVFEELLRIENDECTCLAGTCTVKLEGTVLDADFLMVSEEESGTKPDF